MYTKGHMAIRQYCWTLLVVTLTAPVVISAPTAPAAFPLYTSQNTVPAP
jgi:hypothetical protein